MTDLEKRVMSKVRNILGDDRLERAIVYLNDDLKRAAERVSVGDVNFDVPWDSHIIFVDLEPGANWGHACAYLAVRFDGDGVIQIPAHLPPFLKVEGSGFRLLWRGPRAPEWAVN